jgi:hypothetical protein
MEQNDVKESRRVLRRIQDHLYAAHANLGAQRETVNLVDVMVHPTSTLASLNYVTPRRSTAWVSGEMIAQGLAYLRQKDRIPRVHYIEGLFPPVFARSLYALDLELEWETSIMAYLPQGFSNRLPSPVALDPLPDGIRLETVTDERGIQLWWYVWRSAFYEVAVSGAEPLFAGRDLTALKQGSQIDILLYQKQAAVGVARLSIHGETAHLLALALMKEAQTPELLRLLYAATIDRAIQRGCTLIYAPGQSETHRQAARALGFLDFGSIVCYAARVPKTYEVQDEYVLGQPVLTLR